MPLDARTDGLAAGDLSVSVARDGDAVTVDGAPADARLARLDGPTWLLTLDGRTHTVTVERAADGRSATATVDGVPLQVALRTDADRLLERFGLDAADGAGEREVRAPMPGLVLRVLAEPGAAVAAGDGLVVLEAMKMENELAAPRDGTVAAVHAAAGDAVAKGDLLVELDG